MATAKSQRTNSRGGESDGPDCILPAFALADPPISLESVLKETILNWDTALVQCVTGILIASRAAPTLEFKNAGWGDSFSLSSGTIRGLSTLLCGWLLDVKGRRPLVYSLSCAACVSGLVTCLWPDHLLGIGGMVTYDCLIGVAELGALLLLVESTRLFNAVRPVCICYFSAAIVSALIKSLDFGLSFMSTGRGFILWWHYLICLSLSLLSVNYFRYYILYDSPCMLAYQERHLMVWDSIKLLMPRSVLARITDNYRLMYGKFILPRGQPTIRQGFSSAGTKILNLLCIFRHGVLAQSESRGLAISLIALYFIIGFMKKSLEHLPPSVITDLPPSFRTAPIQLLIDELLLLPGIILAFRVRKTRKDFVALAVLATMGAFVCLCAQYLAEGQQHILFQFLVAHHSTLRLITFACLKSLVSGASILILTIVLERVTIGIRGTFLGFLIGVESIVLQGQKLPMIQDASMLLSCLGFIMITLLSFRLDCKVRLLGEKVYEKEMALKLYLAKTRRWNNSDMATVSSRMLTDLSRGSRLRSRSGRGSSRNSSRGASRRSTHEFW